MRAVVAFGVLAAVGSSAAARKIPAKPRVPRSPVEVCSVELEVASETKTPSLTDLAIERGRAPEMKTWFRIVEVEKRIANAKTIAAIFPASWHATVELDATAMAHVVAFDLPGTQTPEHVAAPILAFVRAHPCLFGVTDPKAVSARVVGDDVIVDQAPRTIGALSAHISANTDGTTTVHVAGHLWPTYDRGLTINKHYIRRYLARTFEPFSVKASQRRKTFDRDFVAPRGPVFTCDASIVQLSDALVVELAGAASGDPVLAELPAPIDPTSGKPLPNGWIAPAFGPPDASRPTADRMNDAGRTCLGI